MSFIRVTVRMSAAMGENIKKRKLVRVLLLA